MDAVAASAIAAGLTLEERAELLNIGEDAKGYFAGDMASVERRAQPRHRGRVMAMAKRMGIDDVVRQVIDAGCREPGLSSVEDHQIRGTQRAAQFLLRAHVGALCLAADAEF